MSAATQKTSDNMQQAQPRHGLKGMIILSLSACQLVQCPANFATLLLEFEDEGQNPTYPACSTV
jgi:hypothetical protein